MYSEYGNYDNYNYSGNNNSQNPNNRGYNQQQMHLNKEAMEQVQDQKFSNDTLLRVLATAEGYAIKKYPDKFIKVSRKYGFYDTFGNTKERTKNYLEKQFMFGIEMFKLSYQSFVRNHGNYLFPSNMSKNMIIDDLNTWMQAMEKDNEKGYYYSLITLLDSGKEIGSYRQDIENMEKGKEYYGKIDPKIMMSTVPIIRNNIDQQNERIEKDAMEGRKTNLDAKLYGQHSDNPIDKALRNRNVDNKIAENNEEEGYEDENQMDIEEDDKINNKINKKKSPTNAEKKIPKDVNKKNEKGGKSSGENSKFIKNFK